MLTSVGIIAIYVAEIYDEVKARPIFVVKKPRDGSGGGADSHLAS